MGQRVLQQTDDGAGEHAGNLTAARDGEEDHNQERQVENGEEVQPQRNEGLQEKRDQRNQDRGSRVEAVDLNLLLRCVSDGHASEEYPAARAAELPARTVADPPGQWIPCHWPRSLRRYQQTSVVRLRVLAGSRRRLASGRRVSPP